MTHILCALLMCLLFSKWQEVRGREGKDERNAIMHSVYTHQKE